MPLPSLKRIKMIAEKKHNVSVRGLDKKTLHSLKRIAKSHDRSLNQEIVSILRLVTNTKIDLSPLEASITK